MNYSPKNYTNLESAIDSVLDVQTSIDKLNFSIDSEAKWELEKLESEAKDIMRDVDKAHVSLSRDFLDLIQEDFSNTMNTYCELVSCGYEEELFPFDEWAYASSIRDWKPKGYWINDIVSIKKTDGDDSILITNIFHFYDKVVNKEQTIDYKEEIFNSVLHSINKVGGENKELLKNIFIYSENSLNAFYKKKEEIGKFRSCHKVFLYLNHILKNIKNEEEKNYELNQWFEKIKDYLNKMPDQTNNFNKYLTDFLFKNGAATINKSNSSSPYKNDVFIKLLDFEFDFELNFTSEIIDYLKKEEEKTYLSNQNKESVKNLRDELSKTKLSKVLDKTIQKNNIESVKNKI